MRKLLLSVLLILAFCRGNAQEDLSLRRENTFFVESDSIQLDSTSIRRVDFELLDADGNKVADSLYYVDFPKARLYLKGDKLKNKIVIAKYSKYPNFLTKSYARYDKSKVIGNIASTENKDRPTNAFVPFDGLTTAGSITRGVTIGNNQNAVVNSTLDLQISGKLSDKVSLRASIQDSNIPLQDNGYSQRLDEFDQIFIELAAARWNIRAGDMFLENRKSRFLNFSKKVQGVLTNFKFGEQGNQTNVFGSAALVRGQYARSTFVGSEGNQGPYKLYGPNGEAFILIVSGSERVFVNGIQLQRGENNQYTIDYNAGEITFTSLFQITSEMRINVEYQYAERNFTRLVTYAGANHQNKNWSIGGAVYSESDIKNQALQQNLNPEQVAVLQNAGDDQSLMFAPSAIEEAFDASKIQYQKVLRDGIEVFEASTDESQTLFNVRFSQVGQGNGNYVLQTTTGIGRVYAYVSPISGVKQGSFEPVIKLIAPEKLQVVTVSGSYNNLTSTKVQAEISGSSNDKNLYSSRNDGNNTGTAANVTASQRIIKSKFETAILGELQFIGENFRTIERAVSIEFNRDWNTTAIGGDQKFYALGFRTNLANKGAALYRFEGLSFGSNYQGNRHVFDADLNTSRVRVKQKFSYLSTSANVANSSFLRNQTNVIFAANKRTWISAAHAAEANAERLKSTGALTNLSQRFNEFAAFAGRGDSLRVFAEVGTRIRINDSLQNSKVARVNNSVTYLLRSRILQSEKQDLMLFGSFRNLRFTDQNIPDQSSLNSRIAYNGRYFNRFLAIGTTYENISGTVAQQEFSYLEVEPGQGIYMWNDYNINGVKELEEFEIAAFPDQAIYLRVFLPNQVFVPSHINRLSQNLTLNFAALTGNSKLTRFLKKLYNQTSVVSEQKVRRVGNTFNLSPFGANTADLLGQTLTFRNSFFYNKGKQNHSITINNTASRNSVFIASGLQENNLRSTQFLYAHLIQKTWLMNAQFDTSKHKSLSENYADRNFEISAFEVEPKVSYLFSRNANLDFSAAYGEKRNTLNETANLIQRRATLAFNWNSEQQFTASGELNLIGNLFEGDRNSAVAFQMLEALQPGQNITWRLSVQKNLTGFLDLTLNYQGRKSDFSQAIHTGSVQVRAHF